jgi:hypothetical protein
MPNFDGGHYFLSVLIPIKSGEFVDHHGVKTSPVHRVREELATLPKARQSKVTEETEWNSPFARNTRTHFARFVIIDDTVYNGRNPVDALRVALGRGSMRFDPTTPQSFDQLNCPYIFFAADFDARDGSDEELRSYLSELWRTMQPELRAFLTYCVGFNERVSGDDPAAFCDYIKECQIETTMPFNDYDVRVDAPLPQLVSLRALALWGLGTAVAAVIGVVMSTVLLIRTFPEFDPWVVLWVIIAAIGIAALYALYKFVLQRGDQPFPTVPDTTLPSVLKALYLQQQFTDFVIATQGLPPADLHAAFGRFLEEHKTADLSSPTQEPGVIKTRRKAPA